MNFLKHQRFSCVADNGGTESSQISSKKIDMCSEDERKPYRFGTTWVWTFPL